MEYFISSLPMLLEDQPAKISPAAFAEMCGDQLDPALAAAANEMLGASSRPDAPPSSPNSASSRPVGAVLQTAPSSHPFLAEWRDREIQLRNAVAAERARRLGATRPAPRDAHGCEAMITQGVAQAFAAKDPLQRERALDALRWRILDELQGIAPFTEAAVLSYAGKLALNARRFSIEDDKGMEKFKSLTSNP
ncbi:MAG: DUF2764 family protein [Kiritimatiellae bacterium]|nr:DUF2764 family protein [Kiritimatiellia bacterium]